MKKILLLLTLFSATSVFAQTLTLGQAINMAGKQRMLSQRMAKDKIYKTMNQLTEEVNKELNSSILLFEQNLKLLFAYAPTKEIKQIRNSRFNVGRLQEKLVRKKQSSYLHYI